VPLAGSAGTGTGTPGAGSPRKSKSRLRGKSTPACCLTGLELYKMKLQRPAISSALFSEYVGDSKLLS